MFIFELDSFSKLNALLQTTSHVAGEVTRQPTGGLNKATPIKVEPNVAAEAPQKRCSVGRAGCPESWSWTRVLDPQKGRASPNASPYRSCSPGVGRALLVLLRTDA